MAEEHKLELVLTPKIDIEALKEALQGTVFGTMNLDPSNTSSPSNGNSGSPGSGNNTGSPAGSPAGSPSDTHTAPDGTGSVSGIISDVASMIQSINARIRNIRKTRSGVDGEAGSSEDVEMDERRRALWKQTISNAASMALRSTTSGMKKFGTELLGFVEDIYKRMKQASPLLQAVESMFNLAVQLFFMPLGNKLAEIMIPAVVDLLDKVTAMWNAYEGMTLGEMVTYAIKEGTSVFGEYLVHIGASLSNEEGIVGTIGTTLEWLGNFIKTDGERLLMTVLNLADWLIKHIGEFIVTYISLKGVEIGAQTFASLPVFGSMVGAAIGGGIGLGASAAVVSSLDLPKFGTGGHVPYTPGGQVSIVGESEGEYIIPESKMGKIGNTIINNFYIEGVTSEELGRMIDDRVNEQISLSKIGGVF